MVFFKSVPASLGKSEGQGPSPLLLCHSSGIYVLQAAVQSSKRVVLVSTDLSLTCEAGYGPGFEGVYVLPLAFDESNLECEMFVREKNLRQDTCG